MQKAEAGRISYYEILFLAILLSVSFLVRIYPIHYSHWWDECVYLQHAEIILGHRGDTYNEFDLRPPLLPFILATGILLYDSPFSASVLIAVIGTLGVLFVYLLARKLFDSKTASLSSIFMGLVPFIMINARIIMTDIPSLTIITASFYFFVLFHGEEEKRYLVISGLAFSLAVLMKFTAGVLLPVFIMYAILHGKPERNLKWFIQFIEKYHLFIISVFIPILPYLVWSWISYGSPFHTIIHAMMAVGDFNEPFTFYIANFITVFSWIVFCGFILSIAFICIDLYKNKKADRNLFIMFFWVALFIFFLSIGAHKELRYMLPAAAPIIILAGNGFGRMLNTRKLINIAILLLLLLSVISFSASFERLNENFINMGKSEEVIASEFIKDNLTSSNNIYTSSNYPVFGYYTNLNTKPLWVLDNFFSDKNYSNFIDNDIIIIYKNTEYEAAINRKKQNLIKIKEYTDFIIYKYVMTEN